MNELRKEVKYKGKIYDVGYSYSTQRCINGKTTNTVVIYINNIATYISSWEGTTNKASIIYQTKITIQGYIDSLPKNEFPYIEEFQNWDGDLDKWDE